MKINLKFVIGLSVIAAGIFFVNSASAIAPVTYVITNPAVGITMTDATLIGVNGYSDATGHSFWVSTSTFSTASPSIPDGVHSTPDFGAIPANTPFTATLSSITTSGVYTNLPPVTPNTTYYVTAWSLVDGTWRPGEILSFTTAPDTIPPSTPVHVSPADGSIVTPAALTEVDWSDSIDLDSPPVSYIYESSQASTTNPDGSFTNPVYTSSALSESKIPTAGTPTGIYFWHVKAKDSAAIQNSSPWTNPWRVTVAQSQTITVTVPAPASAVYGDTFSVAATADSGLPVEITTTDGCSISAGTVTITNATTSCVVHYNQAGDNTYSPAPEIIETVTTAQRPITLTAIDENKIYDGTTDASTTPTLTGTLAAGDTATLSETYDTRDVGTGKTLTPSTVIKDASDVDMTANYAITFVPVSTGEISVRAITVTAQPNTKTYDRNTTATATPVITETLGFGDTANFIETYDTRDVGTNKVLTPSGTVIDGNSGNNYSYTFVNDTTGVITPKEITVIGLVATPKIYDATTTATVLGLPLPVGVIRGDVVRIDNTAVCLRLVCTGTFDTKNVGHNTVTVTGLVLTGADAGNYTLTPPTLKANILKHPIRVTAALNTKIYDGTTDASTTPTITFGTLSSGDTATLTETYNTRDVGTGKTLTPSAVIKDASDVDMTANYAITFVPVSTGEISIRAITVTADNISKEYGTPDPALTTQVTSGSLVAPDTLSGSLVREVGEALGTYPIHNDTLTAGSNYDMTFVDGVFSVVDTTPPVITEGTTPADIYTEFVRPDGTTVSYTSATATDNYDQSVDVSCIPLSGSVFALGTTTVTCSSTDSHDNHATSTSFNVVVQDTIAPTFEFIAPTPADNAVMTDNQPIFKIQASEPLSSAFISFGLSNNGFENSTADWTLGGYSSVVSNDFHSGSHSLLLQTTNDNQGGSYNYAYRTVSLPSSGPINLSAWLKQSTVDGIRWDQQRIYLTDTSGNVLGGDLMYTLSNSGWHQVSYDLSAYAGQTVRIYFAVHDDGAGDPSRMWIDDVSINGNSEGSGSSTQMTIDGQDNTIAHYQPSALNDGILYYQVSAYDIGNNVATSSGRSLTIDTTAPTLEITSPSNNSSTTDNTISNLNFTASDSVDTTLDYAVYVDDVTASGTPAVTGQISSGGGVGTSIPAQTDGLHTITVKVTDDTNHTTLQTISVTVDTVAPLITSINATGTTTVQVIFSEDLQNNSEGHHPRASDFVIYNGESFTGDNSYGISDVGYADKKVTITLTDPIKTGDSPHLDIITSIPALNTIIDSAGNYFNNEQQYDHKVYDRMAPVFAAIDNIATETSSIFGKAVTFETPAVTDVVDTQVTVTCDPISGSVFPTGTTTVTCSATDATNNTATSSFEVYLKFVPPVIPSLSGVGGYVAGFGGGFGGGFSGFSGNQPVPSPVTVVSPAETLPTPSFEGAGGTAGGTTGGDIALGNGETTGPENTPSSTPTPTSTEPFNNSLAAAAGTAPTTPIVWTIVGILVLLTITGGFVYRSRV